MTGALTNERVAIAPLRGERPEGSERTRVLFALAGLGRVNRGAEVAFENIAREVAARPGFEVTLIGSGDGSRAGEKVRFVSAPCAARERFEKWPTFPPMRSDLVYEEFAFVRAMGRRYDPREYDATITCAYPFTNWMLRRKKRGGRRPAHIFVTQNGDYCCHARRREFRYFGCDGLVCTNPEYFERNRERWASVLIPNGVDPERFSPGAGARARFGLPQGQPVVLMVSALIESKRVLEGIEAMALVPGAHLIVAGDGPLRERVDRMGAEKLPGRFSRVSVDRALMPELYRNADVFLHMSLDEPSSNAYIEALSTGLPIVTHDRSVTRWTFEETATLVDARNLGEVALGVRNAMDRRSAGDVRARRDLVARRFTWNTIGAQYGTFIRETIARRERAT